VTFNEMMQLAVQEPDRLIGTGPRYPWGGLYGGQIVAQSLRAAASTVAPEYQVHSLHCYFIRKGDASEPIRFEIDRLRDGRTYVTRAVVARQSMGAILHMSASFQCQRQESFVDAFTFPVVPAPAELVDDSWGPMFDRATIGDAEGRVLAWLRIADAPEDDPVSAACALAFLSDDLASDAVRSRQQYIDGVTGRHWNGISLDHSIWFHHPIVGNDWQLHDFRCEGLGTPRGLALGRVYSSSGTHLASVAQEVLLRRTTA
jgi:acyl-CoA thioesterase II